MKNLVKIGSKTAKNGFKNEDYVIEKFNNWQNDLMAQEWLISMNYKLTDIQNVKAIKIKGSFKADIQVQIKIEIQLKELIDVQNLQVKLVSQKSGFNQIDKRWVDKYAELWEMNQNISRILKHYTGEIEPYISNPKNLNRMLINEFSKKEQNELIEFIKNNKSLIVCDILKGRGQFCAEWMLVILKVIDKETKWSLKPMNFCLNLFGNDDVVISKKGNIKIGKITMQRKGGDGGRKSAQMLQFKINPCLIFD